MRSALVVAAIVAALTAVHPMTHTAQAQAGLHRSKSAGFFLGGGFEGDGITTTSDNVTESGSGASLVLGYGFSPRWSLYSEVSGASVNINGGGGTYTLAHFDFGTRIHFRGGPNIVVPFLQFAIARRGMIEDVNGTSVSGSGAGFSIGGGLNAHFTPAVAFSTAITWTAGKFDDFQVGTQSINAGSVSATSARIHVGMVWFAQ
jgi:Outer membrane protein beta-barrel domain